MARQRTPRIHRVPVGNRVYGGYGTVAPPPRIGNNQGFPVIRAIRAVETQQTHPSTPKHTQAHTSTPKRCKIEPFTSFLPVHTIPLQWIRSLLAKTAPEPTQTPRPKPHLNPSIPTPHRSSSAQIYRRTWVRPTTPSQKRTSTPSGSHTSNSGRHSTIANVKCDALLHTLPYM